VRIILLLVVVVGALIVAGVLHISKSGDQYTIDVDKKRLEQVEGQALKTGDNILHQAEASLDKAVPQPQTR
jgi:hypothetical protein